MYYYTVYMTGKQTIRRRTGDFDGIEQSRRRAIHPRPEGRGFPHKLDKLAYGGLRGDAQGNMKFGETSDCLLQFTA